MAYKRLIAMVPVLDGQVVMSYSYATYKPAGTLKTTLRNLDRWGVDEIVVIDISKGRSAPESSLLEMIRAAAIRTPVAFGGGIRTAAQAVKAIALGCDRVVVERLIWDTPREIAAISSAVGQQAIIGAVPVVHAHDQLWAAPAHGERERWEDFLLRMIGLEVSELLIIDRDHEGAAGAHAIASHTMCVQLPQKLIWFGGLDAGHAAQCLNREDTVGVAFGNTFLITELAAHNYRRNIRAIAGSGSLREVAPHAHV